MENRSFSARIRNSLVNNGQHKQEVASLQDQLQSQQEELLAIVQSQQEQMLLQQEQIAQLQQMIEHQFAAR